MKIVSLLFFAFLGSSMAPTGRGSYPVEIDFNKGFDQRLVEAKFAWVDPTVTAEHFSDTDVRKPNADMRLIQFDSKLYSSAEVIVLITRAGYRLGTSEELLAFAAKYPVFIDHFPVVALGTVMRRPGEPNLVLMAHAVAGRRVLDVEALMPGGQWSMNVRYLAVPNR